MKGLSNKLKPMTFIANIADLVSVQPINGGTDVLERKELTSNFVTLLRIGV